MLLKGRLGLDTARIPHADRNGLLWLSRGSVAVQDGTLVFERKLKQWDSADFAPGHYTIPFQNISMILLGPGTTVSHDALRLMASNGTALAAVGEDGVRLYTAPPLIANRSTLARKQAELWANPKKRLDIARKMYAWRLGQVLPHRDIAVLRGIEGARMKESYRLIASQVGIKWKGRRYDRSKPLATDLPNQALNHAATAVEAAAAIAVSATATIPQLGFVHEDPGQSFVLDISDLYRTSLTIPTAFRCAKNATADSTANLERMTRQTIGKELAKQKTIPDMIEKIKSLFGESKEGTVQA